MSNLSVAAIRQGLRTQIFGQTGYYYPQIGSTNDKLKQLAIHDAPEGMLLVADEQLAGRGRFARAWHAPAGSSLLSSLLFRPTFLMPTHTQWLTMICALAAIEAIARQTGLKIGLKWPNDLVYRDRKLAGILTEVSFIGDQMDWAIVGVGLNINFEIKPDLMTEDNEPLFEKATSLQMILGRPIPRLSLLQIYLEQVEKWYDTLRAGQSPHLAWAANLVTLGRPVSVSSQVTAYHGLAEGVDETGALLVRLPGGSLARVLAGEVTLR